MAVCVLIPAYNAEMTLGPVVRECVGLGYSVVLVDDGSCDHTADVAAGQQSVTILNHRVNHGKGKALRTGFQWALAHGFEAVVTIDADGQHDASALPGLVSAAEAGDADIMIASRFSQFVHAQAYRL
jgi:glycosyltransferase involved in cell wall biosynthesis